MYQFPIYSCIMNPVSFDFQILTTLQILIFHLITSTLLHAPWIKLCEYGKSLKARALGLYIELLPSYASAFIM